MTKHEANGRGANPTQDSRRAFLRWTVGGSAIVVASSLCSDLGHRLHAAVRGHGDEGATGRVARIMQRYGPEFGDRRRP